MRVTPKRPANDAPASHRNDALRRSLRSSRSSPNRIGGSTPRSEPTVARSAREPRRGKAAGNVVKTVVSLALDARLAVGRAGRLVNAHAWPAQAGPGRQFSPFRQQRSRLAILRRRRNLTIEGPQCFFLRLSPTAPAR